MRVNINTSPIFEHTEALVYTLAIILSIIMKARACLILKKHISCIKSHFLAKVTTTYTYTAVFR
jgi:hypothetical protein